MSYDGGKGGAGVYQQIINLMPPHHRYVELFLGAGSVLKAKRPAEHSIGVELDPDVLARWRGDEVPNLSLLKADALEFLFTRDFQPLDLIYADPPYVLSSRRRQRRLYRHEFSDAQHRELLGQLDQARCMVMISGYACPLYDKFFARSNEHRSVPKWRRHCFTTTTRGGGLATECVWLNFPEPLELHDYSYLGRDFRERERIKRKTLRWRRRLVGLPDQERHAILAAIAELKANP